jgi:hypothetical protein
MFSKQIFCPPGEVQYEYVRGPQSESGEDNPPGAEESGVFSHRRHESQIHSTRVRIQKVKTTYPVVWATALQSYLKTHNQLQRLKERLKDEHHLYL